MFKGYRTLILSVITTLTGVLVALGIVDVAQVPDAEQVAAHYDAVYGAILAIVGALTGILRFFTDTPLGKKND